MTNKQKREEEIIDFIFDNLNPGKLSYDDGDRETYHNIEDRIFTYKRILLMYDKGKDFDIVIKKLEMLMGKELTNEFNYINELYSLDDYTILGFRNVQEREYIMTLEVLIEYSLSKEELRSDTLEEILN